MGRVIKPGEIKTQASSMKQALTQENAAVQGVCQISHSLWGVVNFREVPGVD